MRVIDKSKKSNIYCAHCKHYTGWQTSRCNIKSKEVNYWNRCKRFIWNPHLNYKEKEE